MGRRILQRRTWVERGGDDTEPAQPHTPSHVDTLLMDSPAIEVLGLRKVYRTSVIRGRITALDGIDLSVPQGQLFGLLGPNGAGKTTTVKILLGLTRATAGTARISGLPVSDPESRRRAGYLPEGHKIPGYLTARQTLSIFGRMSGLDSAVIKRRSIELLEKLNIAQWIDVRVKKFSKGMTQRLGLATALIHSPNVLLLDEPTDGVDPVGRREIRDLLRDEAKNGTAILVNSHLLSEIEMTCDRVAVLRSGKVVAAGRVEDLTRQTAKYKVIATGMDDALLAQFHAERVNGHIELAIDDLQQLNAMLDQIRASGGLISEMTPMRSTLEDVFVGLVRA